MQLHDRLRRLGRSTVGVRDFGPPAGAGLVIGGVLRLGGSFPAFQVATDRRSVHGRRLTLLVLPEDPHHGAAARQGHMLDLPQAGEAIVLAAGDRESLLPIAVQPFAAVGANRETPLRAGATLGVVGEPWPDLFAWGNGLPAGGVLAAIRPGNLSLLTRTAARRSLGVQTKGRQDDQRAQTQPITSPHRSTAHGLLLSGLSSIAAGCGDCNRQLTNSRPVTQPSARAAIIVRAKPKGDQALAVDSRTSPWPAPSRPARGRLGVLVGEPRQARICCTTLPATSVRRKSRPACRNVSRVWSKPKRCKIVAWKSGIVTLFSAT